MSERLHPNTRHGHSPGSGPSPTYISWASMVRRCTNPRSQDFGDYGARGIAVCDRWRSFSNFLADMGERPDGMSIDRIDNDKGYEPSNCRWATAREQTLNRSVSKLTDSDRDTIRAARAAGARLVDIAAKYQISYSHVQRVVSVGNAKRLHRLVLTAEDANAIRELRRQGTLIREIASKFGISKSHVDRILAGTCWRSDDTANGGIK